MNLIYRIGANNVNLYSNQEMFNDSDKNEEKEIRPSSCSCLGGESLDLRARYPSCCLLTPFKAAEILTSPLQDIAKEILGAVHYIFGGNARKEPITFDNWQPGSPISNSEITIPSPEVKGFNPKQIIQDILWRGDNITISYRNSEGMIQNRVAKEFLAEFELEKFAEIVVSDTSKYTEMLANKPPGVDDKVHIATHMLLLSTQNSLNELGIIATHNGFTPKYRPQGGSEFLVDFDSGKVGLAQTATGVLHEGKLKDASFMVKLIFDCTKENYNTPVTTLRIFDPGNLDESDFIRGLSKKF